MIDFAIGLFVASGLWVGVTVSIAAKCARRNEALARYNGALEERVRRLDAMYRGLSGERELTLVRDGRD